jgi:hypothetical protein
MKTIIDDWQIPARAAVAARFVLAPFFPGVLASLEPPATLPWPLSRRVRLDSQSGDLLAEPLHSSSTLQQAAD